MTRIDFKKPVLVVDDELDIRELMSMTLMKMGLSVYTADGVQAAKEELNQRQFSLVLTDMRMPDGSGLDVVDYINQKELDVPVAVITAYGSADQAVQALKNGAFDYLQKPITLAQLRTLVKSALKIHEGERPILSEPRLDSTKPESLDKSKSNKTVANKSEKEVHIPSSTFPKKTGLQRLLGASPLMVEVRQLIEKISKTNVPVYISGESGSGKEQAARSIHELSERANKPFVAVNCGAIPENLMESEFFGYRKGSFTGADTDKNGFFQHADGGTLFLDEVADLPLAMQVKLLRAIQERAVRRIGDPTEKSVDVRIICATHKDLAAQVAAGNFRQDLFYRLNVVTLSMPPLREMREDLPELMTQLLHKHQGQQKITIHKDAKQALLHYSYPGNFRELENILERAVALSQDGVIHVDDLQINSYQSVLSHDDIVEISSGEQTPLDFRLGLMSLQDYLDSVERHIIEQALQQTRYNRTQAAKLLGISFRSMRYRMERLSIE